MLIRTYTELTRIHGFLNRFEYLKLSGKVGQDTFAHDRYLNQEFYRSQRWKSLRDEVILRDNGCDLGIEDRVILDRIMIHHINPITIQDFENESDLVYDPEFLICTSYDTHNAIHFGDSRKLVKDPIVRTPNDTKLW